MWSLIVESGKHQGRRVKLAADRIVIGRAEDAHIRVGSTDVSRYHCELLPTAHGVLVNDLESRNGTQINDETIATEFLLAPGNTLTVGPMSFRLLPQAAGSASPAVDQGLSDDEISNLLSGEIESLQSDTTVIGGPQEDSAAELEVELDEPAEQTPWVPPPSKMEFESVAEEATDIIRRHREMIAALEAGDDSQL